MPQNKFIHVKILLFALLSAIVFFASQGCQKELPPLSSYFDTDSTHSTDTTSNTDSTNKPDTSLYHVSGSGQDSGEILIAFNTTTNGILEILDQNGNALKQKVLPLRVEDFQRWNINDKKRYTYFQAEGNYTIANLQGIEEGYQIICDSDLNVISKISLTSYGNVSAASSDKNDSHEFILLDDNHYITLTYQLAQPTNIPDSLHPDPFAQVINCIIQEVNNGQVIFQWQGIDHPEFYGTSVENNNFTDADNVMDYMHMNSICIDPNDNNFICSSRNLDQIIKINRTTGEIMWRLGGKHSDFALTDDEVFLRQHFARIVDNGETLMFLDNGDASLRNYSRILEFKLNEVAKTINSFKAYRIPDNFIQFGGSVQKFDNTYFIGGCFADYTLQIDYTTNKVLLRLNQNYPSYRCLKYKAGE
jgi:arylsulfate sulfotransferase